MANNYPIEALLRPPIEWWSGATSFAVGTLAFTLPSVLLLTPGVGVATGILLYLFSFKRLYQGYKIIKYQRNLCIFLRSGAGKVIEAGQRL